MNYLGTVSILDRGDAPAQAVIDRNSRSLAERVANETKEELEKVMHRVENIYENFEMTNEYGMGFGSNIEFVSDIAELAEIIQDQVKKKKYQAQVTVFIVGFQDVCNQRLKLLQQVNEFFLDSMKIFDDDEMPSTPDIDLDDVNYKIDESLDVAKSLSLRLGEINQEIIEFLIHYAENKAKNKGKKKLEKALQAARDDIGNLSEKLMAVQTDLEEKEEKMSQLYKQIEIKTLENQKYRSAAEIAKKNLLDSQALKDDIAMRDEKIKEMRQTISRLEIDLAQAQHNHEQSVNRLQASSIESQQKLKELQEGVDGTKMESNEAKREMEKLHENQIQTLLNTHSKEIEDMKKQHSEEIDNLMEEIDTLKDQVISLNLERALTDSDGTVRHFDLDTSESSRDQSRQSSRQDSRSTSRNNVSAGSKTKGKAKTKSDEGEGLSSKNDMTDNRTVDSRRSMKRSKSTLETVAEGDGFDTIYDLKDEKSWANVPSADIPGRFAQYRKLSQNYMTELEDKVQQTLARMHRKVQTLKGQFQDHKEKWDTERKILMEQVKQAQHLQTDAENEADSTLNELENFITEQEKLEIEEAKKRQELAKSVNLLKSVVPKEGSASPTREEDLQKLLQQTDDAKALATGSDDIADTKSVDTKELPDESDLDEDLRTSSARSRQSLRSQYLTKIEESKKVAIERKNKAAALSASIKERRESEERILDEDYEGYLKEFGYSSSGDLLPEHPVVQEYLKTFNICISFKDAVAKILLDKDMMSASQMISDIEIHKFNSASKVMPQLQKMTKNLSTVLDEVITLLNGILFNDREPEMSAMMFVSREPTSLSQEKSSESGHTPLPTREALHHTSVQGVDLVDNKYILDLQQQCHLLRAKLDDSNKKHEEQLRHNTVVMVEMQDTINGLQRELSALGKVPRSRSVTPGSQSISPDMSVMFTRLDAERNAKIMKKAVNDDKLDQNKYKDAVSQMDQYVNIPAQRFAHLVKKYIHHTRMKYIEETVQRRNVFDEDVYDLLDKMEDLQNQRAKRWAEKMDAMGTDRLKMANLLMETLDNIETESGIFLIKPMYSYRGRDLQQKYQGKLSRPTNSRKSPRSIKDNQSTYGPVPTPASNIRSIHREITSQSQNIPYTPPPTHNKLDIKTASGPDAGVSGAAVNWVGTSSKSTWNVTSSQPHGVPTNEDILYNTPRILELDINRMLIGQNNISTRLSYPLTDDRLVNASQNTLRTYVTVNRPAVQPKSSERPQSVSGMRDSSAPPSTPQAQLPSSAGIRREDVPSKLPSTPPLPPINKNRQMSASSSRISPTLEKSSRTYSAKTSTTEDD